MHALLGERDGFQPSVQANPPDHQAPAPAGAPAAPPAGWRPSPWQLLPALLPNVILPWVIYQLLAARGVPTLQSLLVTAVVPLATALYAWLRDRRVNALGLMTLAFVGVGLAISLLSGDPFFYLVKESLLTGVWGLLMLGSLLAPRPLTFYFGRQFVGGGDAARAAWFDGLWERPAFRALQRRLAVLWGVGLLGEALARLLLVSVLPIPLFLLVSPLMGIGVLLVLLVVTGAWSRPLRARELAQRQAS